MDKLFLLGTDRKTYVVDPDVPTADKLFLLGADRKTYVVSTVQPTQFTNVLDLPTTLVKEGYRAVTTNYTETSDGVAVVIAVKKGTHDIRVRGKWVWQWLSVQISQTNATPRTNTYFSTTTPTSEAHGGTLLFTFQFPDFDKPVTIGSNGKFSIDECGDWYLTATVPQDGYLAFTLKDMSKVFAGSGTFNCAPIITVDEPIGNGGRL